MKALLSLADTLRTCWAKAGKSYCDYLRRKAKEDPENKIMYLGLARATAMVYIAALRTAEGDQAAAATEVRA